MNKLLKKIYESVIYYEQDTIKMGNHIELEIKKLIRYDKNQWTDEDMEKIKNLMY